MNAPGKGILKVVSILYIVFGGIWALFMILSLFLGSAIAGMLGGMIGGWVGGVLFVIFLIAAAVNLVIGIIGSKKADDPTRALFFIVVGIILAILTLISLISDFSIWNLLGLVMPILFIVGGVQNRNAAS